MTERGMRTPKPPRRPTGSGGKHAGKPPGKPGRSSGPSHRAGEQRGKPFRSREAHSGKPPRDDGERRFQKPAERPARRFSESRGKPQPRDRETRGQETRVQAWGAEQRTQGPRGKHPRKPFRPKERDRDGPVLLYGWHSVKAALENPARKFIRIWATENGLHRLKEENIPLPIEPELVRAEAIDLEVGPDAVHQGLLAEVEPLPSPDIDDIDARGVILVLDQITDPHNVGAILRSAAAFAVTAVVTTLRHSPEMTGVLAKAASGALEYVPMITVPNLARALEALKKKNVFVIGLDSDGDASLGDIRMDGPTAIVVGAEGKGLRQLTRATCDQVARLDLPGKIRSLNVSNATALALYVATGGQQRS
jgi:23S rRNA (guanosine2251-2'-O)-methyltransferase